MPPKHFEVAINKLEVAQDCIGSAISLMAAIGVSSIGELEQTQADIESDIRLLHHESTRRDAKDYGTMALRGLVDG